MSGGQEKKKRHISRVVMALGGIMAVLSPMFPNMLGSLVSFLTLVCYVTSTFILSSSKGLKSGMWRAFCIFTAVMHVISVALLSAMSRFEVGTPELALYRQKIFLGAYAVQAVLGMAVALIGIGSIIRGQRESSSQISSKLGFKKE